MGILERCVLFAARVRVRVFAGDGRKWGRAVFLHSHTFPPPSSHTHSIKEIEEEMARTQKNKVRVWKRARCKARETNTRRCLPTRPAHQPTPQATEYHLGQLKAKLAKLRTQLQEPAPGASKGGGEGFEVARFGDGRIALIGFPSVGKSTLLTALTGTKSEAAAYEFTTLTCIPATIHYNDAKLQLLDLPGIIEGAVHGRGRGRQVIAVCKSADLLLMVLDAARPHAHKAILTAELEAVGIRLNRRPPDIYFKKKKTGGVAVNATVPLTRLDDKLVCRILAEYKIHNAEVLLREDCTADDLIDVIEGNRRYVRCVYVYNKIDVCSIEEVDAIARLDHAVPVSASADLNLDRLLATVWAEMALVRVYTKKVGGKPDFAEPVVLSTDRGGTSVRALCEHVHRDMVRELAYALVWGRSSKHYPQRTGLSHGLADEDVVQLVKRKVTAGEGEKKAVVTGAVDKKKKALKT